MDQQPQQSQTQPTSTPQQPDGQPVAQPQTAPVTPAVESEETTKAHKTVRTTAIIALVLGGIAAIVGLLVLFSGEILSGLPTLAAGAGFIVSGVQLLRTKSVASYLVYLKVLTGIIAVMLLISILSVTSPGVLLLVQLLFVVLSFQRLYKAGLTTSAAPFMAKLR
jgi:hypothetical protein